MVIVIVDKIDVGEGGGVIVNVEGLVGVDVEINGYVDVVVLGMIGLIVG